MTSAKEWNQIAKRPHWRSKPLRKQSNISWVFALAWRHIIIITIIIIVIIIIITVLSPLLLLFLLVVAITMTASSMLNILVPRTTVTLGSWTRARSQPETKIALGPRCHGTAGRLLFVIHNNNAYGSALRTPNTTPVHNDYFDGYINYALAKLQKWWWFGCVKSHALFEDDEPWQLLFKPLIHNHVSG